MIARNLCLTFRFLDPLPTFHGRGDANEAEWPPSPLRMFQALLDASMNRWRTQHFQAYPRKALLWLQSLPEPVIIAPANAACTPFRIAVPNNDLDAWAGPISKGNDPKKQPNELKTLKTVMPTRMMVCDGEASAVHYLFPLADGTCPHFDVLQATARSVTHLGWGIDMVAGNAEIITEAEAAALAGEVWRPVMDSAGTALRVPVASTLDALMEKHQRFLGRLADSGFKPVPPLSAFRVVHYRRATDAASRPWCAFAILKPNASGNRAFDTARRARDVAAWVRHAAGEICAGWSDVDSFVHGHAVDGKQAKGAAADDRFQFLPLPTINPKLNRVESIRRVLIAVLPQHRDRIDFIRRRLPGQELIALRCDRDEKYLACIKQIPDQELCHRELVMGMLNILPTNDWVLKQYTGASPTWSTVTPVILPGHDDRDAAKAEGLLRKAFVQAGLSSELVAGIEELEWRNVGFRAGLELATKYRRPENLNGPVFHVRVRFAHAVRGPLAMGAGRYRGLGLFAADDASPQLP